jgi:hypothetical protein
MHIGSAFFKVPLAKPPGCGGYDPDLDLGLPLGFFHAHRETAAD